VSVPLARHSLDQPPGASVLGKLAALRGDGAARLLRRAFADGMPYESFIHRDPHFLPVRREPEFAALLAPRG
jgi:hypothetical protein